MSCLEHARCENINDDWGGITLENIKIQFKENFVGHVCVSRARIPRLLRLARCQEKLDLMHLTSGAVKCECHASATSSQPTFKGKVRFWIGLKSSFLKSSQVDRYIRIRTSRLPELNCQTARWTEGTFVVICDTLVTHTLYITLLLSVPDIELVSFWAIRISTPFTVVKTHWPLMLSHWQWDNGNYITAFFRHCGWYSVSCSLLVLPTDGKQRKRGTSY